MSIVHNSLQTNKYGALRKLVILQKKYGCCLQIVVKHALEISLVVFLSVITFKNACAIIEYMDKIRQDDMSPSIICLLLVLWLTALFL